MTSPHEPPRDEDPPDDERVDEESRESFPASDAPSHWADGGSPGPVPRR